MNRFFGFDLGDAESAVARLEMDDDTKPVILKICDETSLITAYATTADGKLLIGERACYQGDVIRRKLRFKSRFLTDPRVDADVTAFAAGVLGELYGSGDLIKNEDCCFYVGCPAGWSKNDRERYRAIFEKTGYPPTRIISESRAAMISACQSRHLQVGWDILHRPVLVCDIGSSTTDFAYICSGKEVEMQTGGEVALGGGVMDEILLEEAIAASPDPDGLREIFEESEPWRTYCEFAARKLKEDYFSDEAYWEETPCTRTIMVYGKKQKRLVLRMDSDMAKKLLEKKVERLGNRSFRQVFEESLEEIRNNIKGEMPQLLFLTGGVSRLPEIRTFCVEKFPEAVVITGAEPEFSVARGLAWTGRVDEQLRRFREELEALKASRTVEDIVEKRIKDLYHNVVDTLVEPIMVHSAIPVFERWRDGEITRLKDTEEEMQRAINEYLQTDEARELLMKPVTAWLKPVADELEEYTVPICLRHNVPYSALSLKTYLPASDLDIHIEAKNVFAVEEITWMIDSIITVLVGLMCGGSGIALISSGPVGIAAGFSLSFLVLLLGKDKMEDALLSMNIPKPARKLVPRKSIENRMDSLTATVKENLYRTLEEDRNEEISARMTEEISHQIEECLTRMAEVVEIPLG